MKLNFLLLFLVVLGFCGLGHAQTTKPYTQLLITESQQATSEHNYIEFTNMGSEIINLKNFEFGYNGAWDGGTDNRFPQVGFGTNNPAFFMLPDKELAPGESFVIATASDFNPENFKRDPANYRERVTVKDFYDVRNGQVFTIADLLLHRPEATNNDPTTTDEVTVGHRALEGWGGRETYYLRHHWIKEDGISEDSAVVDQVGGVFDEADGTNKGGSYDVAGVAGATWTSVLIRRNSVKTGNLNFDQGRGKDFADSEWIPVTIPGGYDHWGAAPWRRAFWTVGNQVNATLTTENIPTTLVSKTGKVLVDANNLTITVPYGVRKNDSLMFQFQKTPGLAWEYKYSDNSADSTYLSARTGDTLTVYACGDVVTVKKFHIIASPATATDNIVIPKTSYDYEHRRNFDHPSAFGGMRITDGVSPIDSITHLAYATRVDTLLKYLEKPEKATWKVVYASGVAQPDLKTGDKLVVTSESGVDKEYFIKLEKFVPNTNSLLSAITWPDMPSSFKGEIAETYGWVGDTIPGFSPAGKNYVVQVPMDYEGIPALIFKKEQTDSKVEVVRAKNLTGSVADRTTTVTVTAENDTVSSVYTIRFDKEQSPVNIQPFVADPFISQIVFRSEWATGFVEIANPGTENLDLSNYMITANWGPENPGFDWNNANTVGETGDYKNRYMKYIPGRKWQDEASWQVESRIAIPDNAVNPIVYPGDVFVMGHMTRINDNWISPVKHPYAKEMDINFGTVPSEFAGYEAITNPWNEELNGASIPNVWCNNSIYLYKILNDSVKNGTKAAIDRNDFELIESWGGLNGDNWNPDGHDAGSQMVSYSRKPHIYKGNPEPNGSWNKDNPELSEWTHARAADFASLNLGWPWTDIAICTGIGSVSLDEITHYRSTVKSTVYKVSEGYSMEESIRGVLTNTTVTDFLANIIKANEDQALTITPADSETAKAADAILVNGDRLTVLSADSTNTSLYVLEVTEGGLSPNTLLTSATYTITQNGATGTIEGITKSTLLKDVFAGVTAPLGASLSIIDMDNAYMSLTKLNYDTTYVNVLATDKIFFEVVAENGLNKTVYQLVPTVDPDDAYVTSDVYSVDQLASLISFVPGGTSVHSLLSNVYPAPGATVTIFDKGGFERLDGDIYRDDKLVVTTASGKTKVYYFAMLNFYANQYFAFVLSDNYGIDQVEYVIYEVPMTASVAEFTGNLYPSFGATLKVMDANGTEKTSGNLATGDYLVVTAADGNTTNTYKLEGVTPNNTKEDVKISMYPNPTSEKVYVQGLAKGNRLQVFNAAGVMLRDVTVDNSTDVVNLSAQPAGIYIFVVSAANQHINIQKIVKR